MRAAFEGLTMLKSSGDNWLDTAALMSVRQARLPKPPHPLPLRGAAPRHPVYFPPNALADGGQSGNAPLTLNSRRSAGRNA